MTFSSPLENGQQCLIYERIAQIGMDDDPIRPGGLQLTERALSYCGFSPGAGLLDVGCGRGATVKYLREQRGLQGFGVDLSSALLDAGIARHGDLPLLRASGEQLPFPSCTFDGILAECSLSLMTRPSAALKDFYRVLKREGWLLVTDLFARVPEAVSGLRRLPMTCCLTGAFARDELTAELEAAGFSLSFWEDHSHALKHFAARLILSYGSLPQFWHETGPAALDADQLNDAIAAAKPGYFLLIARKKV